MWVKLHGLFGLLKSIRSFSIPAQPDHRHPGWNELVRPEELLLGPQLGRPTEREVVVVRSETIRDEGTNETPRYQWWLQGQRRPTAMVVLRSGRG